MAGRDVDGSEVDGSEVDGSEVDGSEWVNFRILSHVRALCEPGDPDVAGELVDLFCRESVLQLERVAAAARDLDMKELERAAHRLQGGCVAIGAERMAALAAAIVDAARNLRSEEAIDEVASLHQAGEATVAALRAYCKRAEGVVGNAT